MIGSSNQTRPIGQEGLRRGDRLVHVQRVVGVDHQRDVRPDQFAHRAHAGDVLGQVGLADLDLDAVEAAREIAAHAGEQFLQREVQVDAAAVGAAAVARPTRHLPQRLAAPFAAQVPERDVHRRDREGSDAAAPHVVDLPLHGVVQRLDVVAVAADQEGREIVLDHRQHRVTAAPASIGIAGTFAAVGQAHGGGDQLEVRVVTVPGVGEHFGERHAMAAGHQ